MSSATRKKHVKALAEQQAAAEEAYTLSTFVTDESLILNAVNADPHNFTEPTGTPSERHDLNAPVVIHYYFKLENGVGKPVTLEIDGVETACQIGVKKTGDDRLQVTHFQKVM